MPADKPKKSRQRGEKSRQKTSARVRLRTLDDLDKRTKAARDTADLRESIAADLGGWDDISAMTGELVTGASLLGAIIRDRATAYLSGEQVDLVELMGLTNAQRRLLADIGPDRRVGSLTAEFRQVAFAYPEIEPSEAGEPEDGAMHIRSVDGLAPGLPAVIEFVSPTPQAADED